MSSHKRSNKTKTALWEYDKILISMHILKFIDDPAYQQAIRGALNRIEGYHQLIAKIGGVENLEAQLKQSWQSGTNAADLLLIASFITVG